MSDSFDPIILEVMWNRLISIVNEQAAALIRASFSTIVREVEDLSCGIFTPEADMVVQAVTGTPGHINTMAVAVRHFAAKYKHEELLPGDVLISNDAWLCSGHRNDFTTVTPIFQRNKLIGWTATTCHAIDVGGAGFSANTNDVFEEGLGLPIIKIFKQGKPNDDVINIIRNNVRMPTPVMGDIMAQISSQDICVVKLLEFMDYYDLESLNPLADAIFSRSEKAMRAAIKALPDGEYHHEVFLDGFDEPIKIAVAIKIDGSDLAVDYAGTSEQIERGINVPFNYTYAYTTYPLVSIISPDVPSNEGSFRPVTVTAPEGCILNAQFPKPVMGRHLTGHYCPPAVMGAFEKIIPQKTVGDAGGIFIPQWFGTTDDGNRFTINYFASGGMGARSSLDGVHAFTYPSNVSNTPVEVVESISPLFFEKKEIIPDTGGVGKYRGGCGQSVAIRVTSRFPAKIAALFERIKFPGLGRAGGGPGRCGEFIIRDKDGHEKKPHPKSVHKLDPGDTVILNLPGGGGYGPVLERDMTAVLRDVIKGYVSAQSAETEYKVAVRSLGGGDYELDEERTKELRSAK